MGPEGINSYFAFGPQVSKRGLSDFLIILAVSGANALSTLWGLFPPPPSHLFGEWDGVGLEGFERYIFLTLFLLIIPFTLTKRL